MKMNALTIVLLLPVLSACSGGDSPATKDHPYGLWSTERGQTVEVRRDGTFKYCDQENCQSGNYAKDGRTTVLLRGFADMSVTENLRQRSGWDQMRAASSIPSDPDRRRSLELGDGGLSKEFRHKLCQDRPCRIVGRSDFDVYRFVKVRDY